MRQQEQPPFVLSAPASTERPWLASRLLRRQVVNVSTLEEVGRVGDVIFDPQHELVTGLSVQFDSQPQGFLANARRALGLSRETGVVGREHIVSLSGDVVMVSANPSRPSASLAHMSHLKEVCELAILTTYGTCLGALADVLLDARGSAIAGYVVTPTPLAESILPPLEELERQPLSFTPRIAAPAEDGPGVDTNAAPETLTPSASHLRVIPASSQVHFGDSLILLIAEVEPLERSVVVVTRPAGERSASSGGAGYQR